MSFLYTLKKLTFYEMCFSVAHITYMIMIYKSHISYISYISYMNHISHMSYISYYKLNSHNKLFSDSVHSFNTFWFTIILGSYKSYKSYISHMSYEFRYLMNCLKPLKVT